MDEIKGTGGPETGMMKLADGSAQAIVDEVGAVMRQNINMMDYRGCVIASTDKSRVGSLHEGAKRVIEEGLSELYVTAEEATDTSRPGINLPVRWQGKIAGVIGITGPYEEVAGYGRIVKKMVEILLRENEEQERKRMRERVLERFLEDWLLGEGPLGSRGLAERGFRLGIDISLPWRVMVAGPRKQEEYGTAPQGQKLLERAERETAAFLGTGSLILRSAGRQIILISRAGEEELEKKAHGICAAVYQKTGILMSVGIDGGAKDIRTACSQAGRAWKSACMAGKESAGYDRMTLELLAGELSEAAKREYIQKVFKKCSYEELCRWMELLEAYFRAEGSLQQAADALHIHKNTLTYKLKKLEELTGYDVRVLSQSSVFHLAMIFFGDDRGNGRERYYSAEQ